MFPCIIYCFQSQNSLAFFLPLSLGVHHGRFKSFCCVPYFLLVLLVLGCLAAGVALLVQFRIKQYMVVDGVLIAIACILTLTVVGNIVTWAHGFMALLSSQKHRVLNAAEHVCCVVIFLLTSFFFFFNLEERGNCICEDI